MTNYLALKTGFGGQCLQYVRSCFGIPSYYGTAYKAYTGAVYKFHDSADKVPANVPVFFKPSSNGFGHIAYSLGKGVCRTTNSATNTIYNTRISSLASGWHQPYLGWSADLNGQLVSGTKLTANLKRGNKGLQVLYLQIRLKRAGFNPGALDRSFGPAVEAAVRKFQKSRKIKVDGLVGPSSRSKLNTIR